ncbi:MAG: hypothetical protein L3J91_00415 [Thermoplasmata archaeon]|nr:hypothetical protein [Thermoplasmata archaeon]
MKKAPFLWLIALGLALVVLALEPLQSFAIFGSDTGEYFRLTSDVVTTGHVPLVGYNGWGFAYQDFPGIFVVAGATSQAVGIDPLSALITVIPVLSVLSVLPLFLLFRRLYPNDTIAVVGAGFATVAMPRLFSLAHPAPLALGDLFVVAGLWMFLEGRRDVRWYVPLAMTAAALIVTHHLSSYFFLVGSVGGLALFELWRPGRWSRRFPLRELAFSLAFLLGLLAYWLEYAVAFRQIVLSGLPDTPWIGFGSLALAGVLAFVVLGGLLRYRRAHARPQSDRIVRLPSDRAVTRDFLILLAGVSFGAAALILRPLPGTDQTTTIDTFLWFVPLIAAIALAAGARRPLFFQRPGPFLLTWLGAVGLSAAFAIATNNAVLLPARHAEYLLIPVGLLTAIGVGRLAARLSDRSGRAGVIAGGIAVVLLLSANAAIAYPPQADFGGFQEGLTTQDAALWMWIGIGVPAGATVASDHRISSMVFGFDGNNATWDSTPALFTGTSWPAVLSELNESNAPHTNHSVNVVAVDAAMLTGVALIPTDLAPPMSSNATAWLAGGPPFIAVYENGAQSVYWVIDPAALSP